VGWAGFRLKSGSDPLGAGQLAGLV